MSSEASNASSANSTAEPFYEVTVDVAYIREVVEQEVFCVDIREDNVEGDLWETVDLFVNRDNRPRIVDATMRELMRRRTYLTREIRKQAEEVCHQGGPTSVPDLLWERVDEIIADEMHTLFNQPAFWRGLITTVESETIPGMTPDTGEAG